VALFVLKNLQTGRTLTVLEDDAGTLVLTTEKGATFAGGWSPEGILAMVEKSAGGKCLYRAGQWYFGS